MENVVIILAVQFKLICKRTCVNRRRTFQPHVQQRDAGRITFVTRHIYGQHIFDTLCGLVTQITGRNVACRR